MEPHMNLMKVAFVFVLECKYIFVCVQRTDEILLALVSN